MSQENAVQHVLSGLEAPRRPEQGSGPNSAEDSKRALVRDYIRELIQSPRRNIFLSYLLKRVGNEEIARDLLQDGFVAALGSAQTFGRLGAEFVNFERWLMGILKNRLASYYAGDLRWYRDRHERISLDLLLESGEKGDWSEPLNFDDEQSSFTDLSSVFLDAFRRLPANQFRVARLTLLLGVPNRVVARRLRLSVKSVENFSLRAKKRLREDRILSAAVADGGALRRPRVFRPDDGGWCLAEVDLRDVDFRKSTARYGSPLAFSL